MNLGLVYAATICDHVQVKRILVIGHPGAGKSRFSSKLGVKIGLPVIHLDKEFWRPGWVETAKDEWRRRTEMMVNGDEWIIDGTYDGTLDIRLVRADTVIFLDYSRYLCLWRVIKRIVSGFGEVRPDMARGCPERVDLGFLRWVCNYRRNRYAKISECLRTYYTHGKLVVLRDPADAIQFLNEVGPGI
jgi:adenylate kinase family enzyme